MGIKLWNAARIVQIDCDVEVVATAPEEYSESVGGAPVPASPIPIGCIAHYCQTNYRDSNALFSRSVIQRSFIGCDNVAPLRTGSAAGDGGGARMATPSLPAPGCSTGPASFHSIAFAR